MPFVSIYAWIKTFSKRSALLVVVAIFSAWLSSCKDDPEPPPIELFFSATALTLPEGSGTTVTVSLSRAAKSQGTVKVSLDGDAVYTEDYNTDPSGISGSFILTIPAGASEVQFTMASVNDNIFEGDKNATFILMDPSKGFVLGTQKTCVVTIEDDESQAVANFSIASQSIAEDETSGFSVVIPLSASAKGTGSVTVSWGSTLAVYGTNFNTLPAASGSAITIPVANGATQVDFTIVPVDDSYFHEDFVLVFELTAATGSVRIGTDKIFTLTITEDESPSLANFVSASGSVSEANVTGVAIPVSLSIPASGAGTISLSIVSSSAVYGTHFTTQPAAIGNTILLPVSENSIGTELRVLPIDDDVDNANRVITFTITAGGGVVRPGSALSFELTITDNEPTLRQVFVSFGTATAPLVTGFSTWNHAYTDLPNAGVTFSNLVRADGTATTIDLTVITPLTAQPLGPVTGINSGAFPDNALKEYWYVPGPSEGITRSFSLLQLNDAFTYTIRIHGGTTFVSSDGVNTMTVSINGDQKVLADVSNNVTQVLQWVTISPVASTFTFDLTDTNGGGICMINALEISWFEN
ncbi:MAG: hypothetical protein KF803_16995 [Cyclobacteriaceae bacterium]|nr:hypothetical protein [Cyclobacteriaceae bacterium]